MSQEQFARVLVFKDGDSFIAQCLEYDICAHAKDEETLRKRFIALFNFERNLSIERAGTPFAGVPKAPDEFDEMWRACVHAENMDGIDEGLSIPGVHVTLAKCA